MKKGILFLFLTVVVLAACQKPVVAPAAVPVATPTVEPTRDPSVPFPSIPKLGEKEWNDAQSGKCESSPSWMFLPGMEVPFRTELIKEQGLGTPIYVLIYRVYDLAVIIDNRKVDLSTMNVFKIVPGKYGYDDKFLFELNPEPYQKRAKEIVDYEYPTELVFLFRWERNNNQWAWKISCSFGMFFMTFQNMERL